MPCMPVASAPPHHQQQRPRPPWADLRAAPRRQLAPEGGDQQRSRRGGSAGRGRAPAWRRGVPLVVRGHMRRAAGCGRAQRRRRRVRAVLREGGQLARGARHAPE
eukprot:scaffold1941_cov377-Prasinococcus_capsulatus_cf.AAC.11